MIASCFASKSTTSLQRRVMAWLSAITITMLASTQDGLSQTTVEAKKLPVGTGKIEYRSESDPSLESMPGFHQVPLKDLPSVLESKGSRKPTEIRTKARISNNKLIASSEIFITSDRENDFYTLKPFSPSIITDASALGIPAFERNATTPSYFDRDGDAVFRLSKDPIVVQWVADGEPKVDDPSQQTYTIGMPSVTKCKIELTLDSNLQITSSNVPYSIAVQPSQVPDKPSDGSQTWELDCGLISQVSFVVTDTKLAASKNEGVLGAEQIDWIVQSSGLELNASFVFDSTSTPNQISLYLDPSVRVRTITWDQQAIAWSYDNNLKTILIDTPQGDGTYAGTQHRLLVNGVSPWDATQGESASTLRELPRVYLSKSLAFDGRGSISLHSDWELVDFSAKDATLASRSGTTVRGGISRLDFSWRLTHPELAIKLQRRKRPRTASLYTILSSERGDAIATAKVRLNPDSQTWSTLPLAIGAGWKIESCEVQNTSNTVTTASVDHDSNTPKILMSAPVENQTLELLIKLRCAAAPDNSSQFIGLPRTVPLWIESFKQASILEYVPPAGYSLERSVDLVHEAINVATFDTWHQAQIQSRERTVQIRGKDDLLFAERFVRQRPGIASRSILYINKSWGAFQCDYLLECSPDQAGIQALDFQLPSQATNLIWRVLNKDRKEIQEWKWPELAQYEASADGLRNISLVCDRLLDEPFILECQYLLPSDISNMSLPVVVDLVNRNSYVLTENDFQIKLLDDQGIEDTRRSDDLMVRPDEQTADVRNLLSILKRREGSGALYLVESSNVKFQVQSSVRGSKTQIVDHSAETFYCQADGSLVYEIEIDLADLSKNELAISLPKPWSVISASSNEAEFQYVVRDLGDRSECELSNLSNDETIVGSLKLRWLGPKIDLERGQGSISIPRVQGNFQSISHISKVFIDGSFLVPLESSDWKQRGLKNIKALSSPWNWGNDFVFQSNDLSPIDAATDGSRLGYFELTSPISHGTFRDFAATQTVPDRIIPITDRRLVLMLRWIALALSFIVATILMRYSGWFGPWVIGLGLVAAILLIDTELVVATCIGLVLATIVQLAYVVMRASSSVSDASSFSYRQSADQSAGRGASSPAGSAVRAMLLWMILQGIASGQNQEDSIVTEPETDAAVVIPVDTNTFRLAPYAWVKDNANLGAHPEETSDGYTLLSAEHVLQCKKSQNAVFKFDQSALITSTYRFRVDDKDSTIPLPFGISDVKRDEISVKDEVSGEERVLSYGQNLAFKDYLMLIWKPDRQGEFTVKLKGQLIPKSVDGSTLARIGILPCVASKLTVQKDISDLALFVDGRQTDLSGSSTTLAVGRAQSLEMRWRPETVVSTIQYDAETQVFLNQNQPIAMTRLHIVGGVGQKREFTLEWNRNWKPVGEKFRDAIRSGPTEVWNIDYQRCKITLHPSKLNAAAADIEIYWQSVNESSNSIAIPDPRIVEAIPNIRSLRYAKSAKSIWSVAGTDAWAAITSTTASSLTPSASSGANTTLLRIPDTVSTATLQNNFASQERVNVQVHADYLIGSSSSTIHWQGSLVPSYVRTKTQSWIVDNRVNIDSIRINNQEALFAVDRFSDQFNLVRAIGDSEGEMLSAVELSGSIPGYAALTDKALPLINWCNVRVTQSSFNVSRLVGLPTTIDNYSSKVVLDGELISLKDSTHRLPFAERIAVGEESVPYELERPQSPRDEATVARIVQAISQRDMATIHNRMTSTSDHVVNCQAVVSMQGNLWRMDFQCDLNSRQEDHGMVLALPMADAQRLKSKAPITKLGEVGDAAYVYLTAERHFRDETRLHRIAFWIEQKIDSTNANFDIPEIDFISAPSIHCALDVKEGTKKQDMIWDVSHWSQRDSIKTIDEDATHEAGDQLSRYVSVGKIAAIHVEPKPSTQFDLQIPFAYWNIQQADSDTLVLEGLLVAEPKGVPAATLRMPSYLHQGAAIDLSSDNSQTNSRWQMAQDGDGPSRQISINFRPSDLPHLIAVRGTIPSAETNNLEISPQDFQMMTADGKASYPAKATFGISVDCDVVAANSANENMDIPHTIAMSTLTDQFLAMLKQAKPSLDRLTQAQREEYLSSWSRLIQRVGSAADRTTNSNISHSDWIAKYQQIFGNSSTNKKATYIPSSFAEQNAMTWQSIDNSQIKLARRTSEVGTAYLVEVLTLLSWAFPLVLISLVLLPTNFAEQLRSILRDYPWRMLCLLALAIAILPSFLWLSLLLSLLALIICLTAFHRHYFGFD